MTKDENRKALRRSLNICASLLMLAPLATSTVKPFTANANASRKKTTAKAPSFTKQFNSDWRAFNDSKTNIRRYGHLSKLAYALRLYNEGVISDGLIESTKGHQTIQFEPWLDEHLTSGQKAAIRVGKPAKGLTKEEQTLLDKYGITNQKTAEHNIDALNEEKPVKVIFPKVAGLTDTQAREIKYNKPVKGINKRQQNVLVQYGIPVANSQRVNDTNASYNTQEIKAPKYSQVAKSIKQNMNKPGGTPAQTEESNFTVSSVKSGFSDPQVNKDVKYIWNYRQSNQRNNNKYKQALHDLKALTNSKAIWIFNTNSLNTALARANDLTKKNMDANSNNGDADALRNRINNQINNSKNKKGGNSANKRNNSKASNDNKKPANNVPHNNNQNNSSAANNTNSSGNVPIKNRSGKNSKTNGSKFNSAANQNNSLSSSDGSSGSSASTSSGQFTPSQLANSSMASKMAGNKTFDKEYVASLQSSASSAINSAKSSDPKEASLVAQRINSNDAKTLKALQSDEAQYISKHAASAANHSANKPANSNSANTPNKAKNAANNAANGAKNKANHVKKNTQNNSKNGKAAANNANNSFANNAAKGSADNKNASLEAALDGEINDVPGLTNTQKSEAASYIKSNPSSAASYANDVKKNPTSGIKAIKALMSKLGMKSASTNGSKTKNANKKASNDKNAANHEDNEANQDNSSAAANRNKAKADNSKGNHSAANKANSAANNDSNSASSASSAASHDNSQANSISDSVNSSAASSASSANANGLTSEELQALRDNYEALLNEYNDSSSHDIDSSSVTTLHGKDLRVPYVANGKYGLYNKPQGEPGASQIMSGSDLAKRNSKNDDLAKTFMAFQVYHADNGQTYYHVISYNAKYIGWINSDGLKKIGLSNAKVAPKGQYNASHGKTTDDGYVINPAFVSAYSSIAQQYLDGKDGIASKLGLHKSSGDSELMSLYTYASLHNGDANSKAKSDAKAIQDYVQYTMNIPHYASASDAQA